MEIIQKKGIRGGLQDKYYLMLDIKSKLVLKILLKECPNGAYNIVDAKDIISALPSRYKVDSDGLDNIMIYLERQEYISIKYDDEGVYCLCILPFGNEVLEDELYKKREKSTFPRLWILFIIVFVGTFSANLLCFLLWKFLLSP